MNHHISLKLNVFCLILYNILSLCLESVLLPFCVTHGSPHTHIFDYSYLLFKIFVVSSEQCSERGTR